MKKPGYLLTVLAIIISHIMCIVVTYNYRDILCSIEHAGFSGPAWLAFLYAIPFVVGIIVCTVLAIRFHKRNF